MRGDEPSASVDLKDPEIHEQWESLYLNPDLDRLYDRVFERIVKTLAPKPGQTLLDAGCGSCLHAVRLARSGLRVTAVDFSDVALARGSQTVQRAGLENRIELRRADLLELPFSDEVFDFVHCWGVLMHVPRLEAALDELIRVLKPGGKLVVMENNLRSLHVQAEKLARIAKRLLRRRVNDREVTPRGTEQWIGNGSGRLMLRIQDIDFLVRFCEEQGLHLTDRFAGQFTELYTQLPGKVLKRAVYKLNELWFSAGGPPSLAAGNVLVFDKP